MDDRLFNKDFHNFFDDEGRLINIVPNKTIIDLLPHMLLAGMNMNIEAVEDLSEYELLCAIIATVGWLADDLSLYEDESRPRYITISIGHIAALCAYLLKKSGDQDMIDAEISIVQSRNSTGDSGS